MKSFAIFFLSLLFFCFPARAQQPDAEGSLVKWITLEEAMTKVKTVPRPIIMDFYTDWCGWCKRMMQTTYANPALAQYINTNFYAVKFDAEGKDTVTYLGQKYAPVSNAPRTTHPLAAKLLQGKLMYPTTLFLNNYEKDKNEFRFSMLANGYLDEKKIEPILVFMLENAYRNSSYDDFKAQFDEAFYDSIAGVRFKKLNWQKPQDAFTASEKKKSRKTLVLINTDWCNTCRVMKRTSFSTDSMLAYLEKKYNLVDFNPDLTDTISFKGQVFTNPRSPQMPFHQLAFALAKNNFVLPTLAILDEDMNLIDAVSFFMNQGFTSDVLHYYGDDIYKSKSWTEFQTAGTKKN